MDMKKALLVFGVALTALMITLKDAPADGINEQKRSNISFRKNSATDNIAGSPTIQSTSLVMSGIANAQHLMLCHESTSRIRVNWTKSDSTSAPGSSDFQAIIPAAASGSFACFTADDVQMGSTIYIWNDAGSTISSGLFYGSTW